jgi:hypothetical protein
MPLIGYLYILYNLYLINQLCNASGIHSFMRKDQTVKNYADIQSDITVDYDNLNDGEVAWDFPSRENDVIDVSIDINDYNLQHYIPSYLEPYKRLEIVDIDVVEEDNLIRTDDVNSIYNKYVKNNIIFHIKSNLKMRLKIKPHIQNMYLNEAYSNLIKLIYKDVVKIETFMSDIQSFVIESISGDNIESDIVTLIIMASLGVIYNKTKSESIQNLKQIHTAKKKYEILGNYKQIRRNVGIFFIIMNAILNKNVKNAE